MSGLEALVGHSFGPFGVVATDERAEAFLDAIGGDPSHDPALVHPMFANAALFAAAPAFLEDEQVRPFTTSLIHSEQTFAWHRPIPVGAELAVSGTVESVRARGALNFVTFALEASTGDGSWLSGSSVFLMSQEAAAGSADAGEPDEDERPPIDVPEPSPLPAVGASLPDLRCGASRSDLRDYATASGDTNPIHSDHDAARRAGLEGVIVHGLLMAAWVGKAVGRYGSLSEMKVRFRNPLRPAVAALVTGTVAEAADGFAAFDLSLSAGEERLVTARASVTR